MKTTIATVILGLAALAFGACNQSTGNMAMNHNGMTMNHNGMMNGNGAMNHNSMPMNANHNTTAMSHGDMKSSPDAASQPYDLQFLDTMMAHHTGAIDMAEMALKKSTNDEVKKFAQKIIDDQKREISQMKDWRGKWYAGKPPAMNMEMPGMGDSMKMMKGDEMKKMDALTGKDFDIHFIDMMTPHHAGAVTMAKEALSKAEHPEIKTLAGQIKMMGDWKSKWSK
jgi:uncharacterized protein (DUF305 family)